MLYICKWSGGFITFNSVAKHLATSAKLDMASCILSYYENSWDTTVQANRDIRIVDNYLIDSDMKHKVIMTISTQATNKEEFIQQHPELYI